MLPAPYPQTPHIEGSLGQGLLPGRLPVAELRGRLGVVEEKIEGDAVGLLFDEEAALRALSHGSLADPADRRFASVFAWAERREDVLFDRLGDRYALFAECLERMRTVFYDALPDVVIEYDVLDRETGEFLSTERRRALLAGTGVVHVPVLFEGALDPDAFPRLLGPPAYRTPFWREARAEAVRHAGWSDDVPLDADERAEGLYVKVEGEGVVQARGKWIRATFLETVQAAGHWRNRTRPLNRLA